MKTAQESICRTVPAAFLMLALWGAAAASAAQPVLCFSDLTSGPKTGNSDTSLRQAAGHDGAIVTIWGENLGATQRDSKVFSDGVNQVTADGYNAAVNLDSDGEPGQPKALVAYPGAKCLVGAANLERGFGHWVSGKGHTADHWTLSKFTVTAHISPVLLGSGYRVVGNCVTAPTGSAAEGAIEGSGNNLFVLGNEITQVGRPGCSKLYHPIYISSTRSSSGPRRPLESNREIAWNHIHDNNANRGINICSEQSSTAYMTGHRVHDNFIVNQVGDGILIGQYVTGENWVYNNVIAHAGLGPDPNPRESDPITHFGVNLDVGHETVTNTVIHFYHNTIYGCGWSGARGGSSGAVHLVRMQRYTLRFSNNLICSKGEPYVSGWSDPVIPRRQGQNLWFGAGAPPTWDASALAAHPSFVDAANDDFRLQPNSPAIDAGAEVGVRADFAGVPRPQGASPDLGAYEFEKQ